MRILTIALCAAFMPALVLAQDAAPPDSASAQQTQRDLENKAADLQRRSELQLKIANAAAQSSEAQVAQVQAKVREATSAITADKIYFNLTNDPSQNVPFRYRGVAGWWNAVDQYSRLTMDATNMAVAAVLQASELLKPRGAEAQIQYFEQLLPQVKNETVRRAIRLQLIDAYKAANNPERALDELQTLITAAPKNK